MGSSEVKVAIVTGVLALLGILGGGILNGYNENNLKTKEFESSLILKAIESPSIEQRQQNLEFLADTDLISDPIGRNIKKYLTKGNEVPFFNKYPDIGLLNKDYDPNKTDFSIAGCRLPTSPEIQIKYFSDVERIKDLLLATKHVGRMDYIGLYSGYPYEKMKNKISLVVDDSGETYDSDKLIKTLNKKHIHGDWLEPQILQERVKKSPWRITIVTCY